MIYMDNSATSYPKPREVIRAVKKSLTECSANPGRSTFRNALKASDTLYEARTAVAALVGTAPENIVFTYNATYALNIALHGVIKSGMTVAFDSFAHNSVLRPLYALQKNGVNLELLKTDLLKDSVIISSFEKLVKAQKVDALVLTHTSNVTGKQLPVKQLSDICRKNGILLIVDASQGVGSCDVNMEKLGIDILASSGHKGLYGIMGTGFIAIRNGFELDIAPLITGGSGIYSLEKDMPHDLPERLEAGTVGMPGIVSMKAGAEYLLRVGAEEIGYKEKLLRSRLVDGLSSIQGVKVYNAQVNAKSIVLFNFTSIPYEEGADMLDSERIALRAGYHCAPLAHELLKGDKNDYNGALRLSVGYFNTSAECEKVLKAVSNIAKFR